MKMMGKIIAGLVVLSTNFVVAQTAGTLISTGFVSPLNPNGNGFVTSNNSYYTADDQSESEIEWVSIPQYENEPNGDLNVGGGCGTTDIMDKSDTDGGGASYVLFDDPNGIADDGDELMMYRLRVARDPGNGNFGFSVLMDLDGKFGSGDDPDAVAGNPGFEVEIRVVNGGGSKGVHVDDVRGTTSGTNLTIYNKNVYTQRSYALHQNSSCSSKDPVFYDFYIPFQFLADNFGISTSTEVRLIGATSINGASVLGSTASDIGGIDDDNYANSIAGQDAAFSDFINNQTPTAAKNATGGGTLPVELLSFDGVKNGKSTILNWVTGMELDNDFFVIEKSMNGTDFYPIGEMEGQGSTSDETSYSFVDENNNLERAYYRLKQVDFNGDYEYSNVILVRGTTLKKMSMFPNPATELLNLQSNSSEETKITIHNVHGQIVYENYFYNSTQIVLSDLQKGWYFVSLNSPDGVVVEKVLLK